MKTKNWNFKLFILALSLTAAPQIAQAGLFGKKKPPQSSSSSSDNEPKKVGILGRIFGKKDKDQPASSTQNRQSVTEADVDSHELRDSRPYLSDEMRQVIGQTDDVTPNNNASPIRIDAKTGNPYYDASGALSRNYIEKLNFIGEQKANKSAFNSFFNSALISTIGTKVMREGTNSSGQSFESLYFDKVSDWFDRPRTDFFVDMSTLQLSFFNGMTRFLAFNPAFGGNPELGFEPKIWNALVRVMLSNTIPMTPDGILLLPFNTQYELRFAAYSKRANGGVTNAHLVLMDRDNHLLDGDGKPIFVDSFDTLDGVVTDDSWLDQLEVYHPAMFNAFDREALYIQDQPKFDSFLKSRNQFGSDQRYEQCISQWLNNINGEPNAQVADCFSNAGSSLGTKLRSFFGNTFTGLFRGALSGALMSKVFPGISTSAGASYGGLMGVTTVLYNMWFKKEKIDAARIANLISFISKYTFKQGEMGIVHPGSNKGVWAVTKSGLITRVKSDFVKKRVRQEDGTRKTVPVLVDKRLDISGDFVEGMATINFREVLGSQDPRSREAIEKAMAVSANPENALDVIEKAHRENPEAGIPPINTTVFVDKGVSWTDDPALRITPKDTPESAEEKKTAFEETTPAEEEFGADDFSVEVGQ